MFTIYEILVHLLWKDRTRETWHLPSERLHSWEDRVSAESFLVSGHLWDSIGLLRSTEREQWSGPMMEV